MERIDGFVNWGPNGWNRFFVKKGQQWRYKDYRHLETIFDLSVLRGSLLDVGCALGDGLIYLKNKCTRVDSFGGMDFSNQAIETCRTNLKLREMEFFQHDIIKPFPVKYDNIICLETLEHVENPRSAIENLIDAAKSILIVGVPYHNRRLSENHLWSFYENDFSELVDSYCIDRRQRNIYWLVDKQKNGIIFRKKYIQILREFIKKCLKL